MQEITHSPETCGWVALTMAITMAALSMQLRKHNAHSLSRLSFAVCRLTSTPAPLCPGSFSGRSAPWSPLACNFGIFFTVINWQGIATTLDSLQGVFTELLEEF